MRGRRTSARAGRRSLRALTVGGMLATVGMAGVGLAPSSQAAVAHAKSTTITWWASPINTSGPDLRTTLIKAFEKTHPNITVKLETAPTDENTNQTDLVTTLSGGAKTPDVVMGDVVWPGLFGAHGLALPLSKYLPKSFFKRFAPGLVAGASYNGQVYGAPFFQDQGFLYYRKDLLAAAHMSVPRTWEQLRADAAKLAKENKVKYGFVWQGASYEGGTCDFMEYYGDTGASVLNATDKGSVFNVAAATKALSFMRSLVTSGASPGAVDTFQEPQAMTAFADGQAAFMRNWDYAFSTSQAKGSKVIGKVGVAPLPTFAGRPYPGYSTIGGWNLYINPHSTHVQADLTFINFITGVQAQTIEARPPFSEIPTNQAVRTNPAIKHLNPPFAVLAQTKLISRPAQTPNYPKISQAIYANANSAISGSTSPAKAAAAIASGIKAALNSSGL